MDIKAGIKLIEESEGAGEPAKKGGRVTIRLSGWLNKGEPIQDNQIVEVSLGKRIVIPGIEYSVEGMKAGGKRKVRISPHLAYGDKGIGAVPANAVLVYEIELLEIKSGT